MERVTAVCPLDGYRLAIEFDDGLRGEIDLSDRFFGSMFAPLREPALFNAVAIDAFGVISWPNGADLAPDALRRHLQGE